MCDYVETEINADGARSPNAHRAAEGLSRVGLNLNAINNISPDS